MHFLENIFSFTEPDEPAPEVVPGRCYREGRGDFYQTDTYNLYDSINHMDECNENCYGENRRYGAIRFRDVRHNAKSIF